LALATLFRLHYIGTMTLKEYIKKHGPKAVADELGVSRRTVNYWAAGKTRPSRVAHLPKVMRVTGLSVQDIYR
jgi:transcriptional regulator with XRE-family HTH domain